MSVGIRISRSKDRKRIFRIIHRIFPRANQSFSKNNLYFLAIKKGDDAGFLHLVLEKKEILLQGIGVKKEWRGQGIGTELLETAVEYAEAQGKDMLLKVRPENAAALNLYAKKAFTIKKLRDCYILQRKINT
ncbi:GNAT family N-acetyltransferase [Candidatus Micrarchaeota archaeon]|nr:GNAT family N-acetyltransferase [Candidatus Micrarchaeota archaeon]